MFSSYSIEGKTNIEVITLADHRRKVLLKGGSSPHYAPSGHLLYTDKSTLFAIPFDLEKLETRGTAIPVLDDLAFGASFGSAMYDISENGTLVYRKDSGAAGEKSLQWVDADGKGEPLRAKPGALGNASLSPDGRRLALSIYEESKGNIWIYDLPQDTMTRLTSKGGEIPHWTPDGRYIVFTSTGGIFWTRSDGAGQQQGLVQGDGFVLPFSFTPNGDRLAYTVFSPGTPRIWTVPLEDQGGQLKAGKPEQFLNVPFATFGGDFSPDSRWLAYESKESGKDEVFVRSFPAPASGQGGQWQVSNGGGGLIGWSRSGHELLYLTGDQIMAVSYTVNGDAFQADKPRVWIPKLGGSYQTLSPDGKRALVEVPVDSPDAPNQNHEVVVIPNFFSELRRKAPLNRK